MHARELLSAVTRSAHAKVLVGGPTETFFRCLRANARKRSDVPRVRAVLLLCHRLLHGRTHRTAGRAPIQVRRQTDKALANGRDIRSKECRRSFECDQRWSLNLELNSLFLRASPFLGWSSMVDAVLKAARTPLRSAARALPEMTMLHVDVSEKMTVWSCEPSVVW